MQSMCTDEANLVVNRRLTIDLYSFKINIHSAVSVNIISLLFIVETCHERVRTLASLAIAYH